MAPQKAMSDDGQTNRESVIEYLTDPDGANLPSDKAEQLVSQHTEVLDQGIRDGWRPHDVGQRMVERDRKASGR